MAVSSRHTPVNRLAKFAKRSKQAFPSSPGRGRCGTLDKHLVSTRIRRFAKRLLNLLALFFLSVAIDAQAGDFWSRLWYNADQRGEHLLQAGKTEEAAATYTDPLRQAYAKLLGGDYGKAAKGFQPYDDSDAHYNRGNALAFSGKLEEAVKAYDAALERNPNNLDAKHNRDLVLKALQQQKQNPDQQQSKQDQKQDQKQGQNKQDQDKNGQGQQDKQNASGKQDQKQNGDKDQDKGKNGQDDKQQQNAQTGKDKQDQQQAQKGQGQSAQQDAAGQKDDAEQARRDAMAEMARQAGKSGGQPAGKAMSLQEREQQLAREQWLRQIPDDPGGLLRRKFMIEHLMRQQGKQP